MRVMSISSFRRNVADVIDTVFAKCHVCVTHRGAGLLHVRRYNQKTADEQIERITWTNTVVFSAGDWRTLFDEHDALVLVVDRSPSLVVTRWRDETPS